MKKETKKKLLKTMTAVASLAVVAAISFGATMAYLTARTNKRVNSFASGGVDITLNEGAWDPDTSHVYAPGSKMDKSPEIDVNEGSETTYVAMTLQYYVYNKNTKAYQSMTYTQFKENFGDIYRDDDTAGVNAGWVTLDSDAGTNINGAKSVMTYYFATGTIDSITEFTPVEAETGTSPLFNYVKFKTTGTYLGKEGEASTTSVELPNIKIVVNAYAVRASTYDNVTAAKTALDNLIKDNIKSTVSA